ncbi:MAG: helix-turn-helix domain-containing protein [bacterium]
MAAEKKVQATQRTSKRGRSLTRRQRRRKVAELTRAGAPVHEIAAELGVLERTVRRDVHDLRREAAERDPWGDASATTAAFVEDIEAALAKVRKLQSELDDDKKTSGNLYLNLMKLEFSMLSKCIELRMKLPDREDDGPSEHELDDLSDEEALRIARELGIDLGRFARADLRPETAPED